MTRESTATQNIKELYPFVLAGDWLKLMPFVGAVGGVSFLIYKQVKPKQICNLSIKKDSSKVVDMCDIEDLTAEKTSYCRCWRSKKVSLQIECCTRNGTHLLFCRIMDLTLSKYSTIHYLLEYDRPYFALTNFPVATRMYRQLK